jgi:hypothetical protein
MVLQCNLFCWKFLRCNLFACFRLFTIRMQVTNKYEQSNQYYYWNTIIGETSWEIPNGFASRLQLVDSLLLWE